MPHLLAGDFWEWVLFVTTWILLTTMCGCGKKAESEKDDKEQSQENKDKQGKPKPKPPPKEASGKKKQTPKEKPTAKEKKPKTIHEEEEEDSEQEPEKKAGEKTDEEIVWELEMERRELDMGGDREPERWKMEDPVIPVEREDGETEDTQDDIREARFTATLRGTPGLGIPKRSYEGVEEIRETIVVQAHRHAKTIQDLQKKITKKATGDRNSQPDSVSHDDEPGQGQPGEVRDYPSILDPMKQPKPKSKGEDTNPTQQRTIDTQPLETP